MSRRANPRLIGAFVLSALALLTVAMILFASGPLFKKTTKFVAFFDGSVAGLQAGSPVKFRGVTIGSVTEVRLQIHELELDSIVEEIIEEIPESTIDSIEAATPDSLQSETIDSVEVAIAQEELELYFRIPVIFELDEDLLSRQGATVDLDDPGVAQEWTDWGMRAFLATESLVTGRKYIGLDVFPGSPVELSPFTRGLPYPEIPTTKTGFEEIGKELQAVMKKLSEVDIDSILGSVQGTLAGLEQLANSPDLRRAFAEMPAAVDELTLAIHDIRNLVASVDSTITPLRGDIANAIKSLDDTMESLAATANSVRNVISPGSPLLYRLDTTLEEMDRTSVALRALVEYLERNPSAIVRGKPEDN